MQTQQKSCFRIQSRRKQHKEFYPVVAAFSAGFPACAHLLSLNTVNSISSRTGCVKHNLSENDIFLRGLSARIRRYGELVPLPLLSHPRGPHANPAKRFAWGKGGPAAGVSVRACPEANDPKLGPTLSRCGGCATPHCLPLREKHLAPAAQLLFRLRGALCGCDPRLRASCHAAGWAHDRVAKRPFREKCRWASPSLFFRLHVLLAPLCAYPPRFLRSGAWR